MFFQTCMIIFFLERKIKYFEMSLEMCFLFSFISFHFVSFRFACNESQRGIMKNHTFIEE